MTGWIKATEELPIIEENKSRVELPIYVILDNGVMTIADFTKSKFIESTEWVGDYNPIWICRQRGIDISGMEVNVKYWQRQPKPM
jgi:hypothetical protein